MYHAITKTGNIEVSKSGNIRKFQVDSSSENFNILLRIKIIYTI